MTYTVYPPLEGRGFVRFVFWDHAHWLAPKQNTRNLYLQADDKRCNLLVRCGTPGSRSTKPCITPQVPPLNLQSSGRIDIYKKHEPSPKDLMTPKSS